MKNKSKIRAYASVMAWHFSHLHLKYLHIRNSQMKKSFSILIILIILFSSLLPAIFYPIQTEENRKEFYVPPEEENKSSQYISHSIYLYPYSHYSEFRNSDNETCSETGGLYLIELEEIAGRGIQPSEILEGSGEVTLEVMADRGPASSGSYIQEPRNINPYVYGQNYVIRVIDWIYPRANKTLVELAKQIKPAILRFPGGNPADECYWDRYNTPGLDYDTAPAPYTRTLRADYVDAYINFCRQIGAEPFMQVCLKYYNPSQAADLVKYCNKEKGYNIKYWEIGNEPDRYEYQNQPNYSVEQYIDEFMDYYHAMKAVDPSIKIMGSNPCVARKIYEWLEPFLAAVGTNCSVGTSHFYPLWANAPDPQYPNYPTIYNLLRYDTNDWTNSGMLFVERFTKDMRNMMDKYSPGGEIGITEFSTASGGRNHTTELGGGTPGVSDTQAAAVWAADVLGRFGRNGVDIANYWIMASTHDQSFAMILEDWSVRPIYYTYFLYANHFGNKALYTKSSQDDKVSIHASKSSDGSKLYLMIINKDITKTKSATVKISGFDPSYKGASYLLSSTNASSDKANINGWEINKNDVVGSVNKLPADIIQTGKNFNILLPPCSVACIEIGRAGSENPGINITFPKEGDTIGGSIRVSADAIPSLGSVITKVEFQADENQPVNDSSYPFEILWNTSEIAEGMHTLYAKMYCNDGSTFTASVNVSVKRNLVLLEGTKIRSDGVANDFKLIDNVDQLNNYATFDLKKKDSNAIIEFSKPVELELIKIHFWDGNPAKYTFRLECSVNCSVWLGTSWLGTTLGNSSGNSSLTCNSGWQSFNFSNEKVRFVRLVSENTTADKFRVIEFQVFGKFLDPPNALIANVTPTYPIEYENITFIGKLEGPFPLMNASWISNIDGILEYKEDAEFNISDFESKIRVKLSPGKHNITFKATDLSGLEDFANYELTVFGEDSVPKVFILNLSSNVIQRGDTLKADAEFEDSENDVLEIFWFSNIDGLISTNSRLEVSNLSKGVHEISLRARDSMGFWSNESKMVIEVIGPENKIPVAQIVKKSTHATVGKEITFEGKGIDEDGTIIRYEWYSDKDGLISTSAKFSTKNLTKGEHNISFRVCDNEGAWSENATFKIKIEEEQKNSMCGFYLTFNLISILLVVSLMTLSVIYSKVYPKINGRRYKLSRKYRKYKKKTRDLPENIKFPK